MSKNKKVIIASVGILFALIIAVLIIRDPVPSENKEPTKIETPAPTVTDIAETPKPMDDSHEQVAGIIDDASKAVTDQVPGIWSKIKDYVNWLLEFDTKHAIILLAVIFIVVGVLVNGSNANRKKHS